MSQYSIRSLVMAGLIGAGVLGPTSVLADLQVTPRIIGGTAVTDAAADYDAIPWQVAVIEWDGVSDQFGFFCGGSIIADRWVLTAAHCAEFAGNNYIVAGTNNRVDWREAQVKAVARWHIHPGYDTAVGAQFDNDIALLELTEAIDFDVCGSRCAIIERVTPDNESAVVSIGAEALVSGWGDMDKTTAVRDIPLILQYAEINIAECLPVDTITNNMICAYAEGKDTCIGDSGGPLAVDNGNGLNTKLLAGVTSFGFEDREAGIECALPDYPAVYTRVANYDGWIEAVMAGTCCDEPEPETEPTTTSTKSSKSGGGALEWWLLLGLAGLGLRRKTSQRWS